MQKIFGGFPPRYREILRYTLTAALVRLAAWVPFLLAYLQPFSPWLRVIALGTPVLWAYAVCPMRVRYGEALAAVAAGQPAELPLRGLLARDRAWAGVCKARIRMLRGWALPLCALVVFLLPLLWILDAFTLVKVLINVFGGIATAFAAVVMLVPRLITGSALVQPAGIAGAVIVLALFGLAALALFGWGMFRTSGYRFGFTGKPVKGSLKPLRNQNLRLWLPTLALLLVLVLLANQEMGLLFSNLISAAPLFTVKLQWYQLVVLVLTIVSYGMLLPVRKLNTAVWARQEQARAGDGQRRMKNVE